MNERIKELVEQAQYYANEQNDKHGVSWISTYNEKFAELLIKECAIIANRADNTETEIRCMYDVITEHFGVE